MFQCHIFRFFTLCSRTAVFFFKLLILLAYTANSHAQTTVYVDSSIAASGDGSSWTTAYKELNEAMNVSQSNATISIIYVAKGTYKPSLTLNPDSSFTFKRGNIKLYGGYPSGGGTRAINTNPAVMDGLFDANPNNRTSQVVYIADVLAGADSLIIDGFTIANARGSMPNNHGGGIYIDNSMNNKICIRNCKIQNNQVGSISGTGAGMYLAGSYINIINCSFTGNNTTGSVGYGGAIYLQSSTANILNSSFTGNSVAQTGAAIYSNNSTLALEGCQFNNNSGTAIGGSGGSAVASNLSTTSISKCTFTNNSIGMGGGGTVWNGTSNVTISNCIFTGNKGTNGGAIANYFCNPVISNCIFVKDSSRNGGGIYNYHGAMPVVANCTFYANYGDLSGSAGAAVFCADSSGGIYKNCIFWKDTTANGFFPGEYEFYSANDGSRPAKPRPAISYSIINQFPYPNVIDSGNNTNQYPLFIDTSAANLAGPDGIYATADDGLRLQLCSPGIDAGLNAAIPAGITTDIKADARIYNNTVDVGAYENPSPAITGATGIAVNSDSTIKAVNSGLAIMNNCRLIANILPSGASPANGGIKAKVTIDNSVQSFNSKPYVQRHYDIEPASNASSSTASITLYFTQTEFTAYNAARGVYPSMPVDAADAANYKSNIIIHQFHGNAVAGTGPGNYQGIDVLIVPSSVSWSGSNNWWEVTFDVTGFSGFFLSTVPVPIPVVLEYFTGQKQGKNISLNWKANCSSSPFSTFIVERGNNSSSFTAIYNIQVNEQRCLQPFNYIDNSPVAGRNFYRLKMVDANGKITYSSILFFDLLKPENIYAGATLLKHGQQFNIAVQQKGCSVSFYNSAGALLQKNSLDEGVNYINLEKVSAGLFFYRIVNSEQQVKESGKIVIQ